MIFSGLNSIIEPPKGYSGVFENFSFSATLQLIETHHPDFSKIVVVTDYSTTGETLVAALEKEIGQMNVLLQHNIIRP